MNNDAMNTVIHSPETVELETEVLVLGGGLPGVCAAIQAAKLGLNVTLVEKRYTLGGNCGPEIGVHPSDAHRFHPYMVSTGTVGKLIEDAAFAHAKTDSNDNHYNVSMRWDTVMSQALDEAGVRVLRSIYAHTPYTTGSRISAVLCEDMMTYKHILIHVSKFVIDDSGDGNVSERAGAAFRKGRDAKSEFNERFAPDEADSITMGSSLVTLIRDAGRDSPFVPYDGLPEFYPGYGGNGPFIPEEGASLYFWFPTETGGDIDTIEDSHEIYKRLRGHLDSAWNRAKNVLDEGPLKNWEMVWCSAQVGKRESRRFEGDYILNLNDLESGRQFDDAVAVGGFAFDIHYPKPENTEYVLVKYFAIPPLYTIPYRCTYSRNIDNLFFASRLMSVSHLAHGSVRLQRTLATVGQAVGIAAALCAKYDITPRQLYTEGHVSELQQILLREDGTLTNIPELDPDDKACTAKVSASSELTWGIDGQPVFERIRGCAGAELWNFESRLDYCRVLLRNPTGRPISTVCTLSRYTPKHKWQSHGENPFFDYYDAHNEVEWGSCHKLSCYEPAASTEYSVPAGFCGYVDLVFNADLKTAKDPLTDDDRLALVITPQDEGLEIARRDGLVSYMRSIEGICEEGGEPAYTVHPRCCFASISPAPLYGEASQVINGWNRRYSENPHNMWHPAELPAQLCLNWDAPITASQVRITFDTLERVAWTMPYESNKRVSPQCVKRFSVTLTRGDNVVYRTELDKWHNRLAVIDFGEVSFDRLTLNIDEVWDSSRTPGVYEVRVY